MNSGTKNPIAVGLNALRSCPYGWSLRASRCVLTSGVARWYIAEIAGILAISSFKIKTIVVSNLDSCYSECLLLQVSTSIFVLISTPVSYSYNFWFLSLFLWLAEFTRHNSGLHPLLSQTLIPPQEPTLYTPTPQLTM